MFYFIIGIIAVFLGVYVLIYFRYRFLVESAAFWVFTFSTFALLAILVMNDKFDRRERGIEMKQAARVESYERVFRGEAIDPLGKIAPPQGVTPKTSQEELAQAPGDTAANSAKAMTENDSNPNGWSQVPEQNAKTLDFLQWLCAAGALTGAALLVREATKKKRLEAGG